MTADSNVSRIGHTFRAARRFGGDRRGVSAIEFALLSPVYCLVLAGTLDFGSSLYNQFGLNAAVSAGAIYAIANAGSVTSTGAGALSDSLSKLTSGAQGSAIVTGVAVVNSGVTSTTLNGATSRSGSASTADSCYCPTLSGATVAWGSAMACASACPGGSYAGKFVTLTASRASKSFLGAYSLAPTGKISAKILVQVQ